MKKTVFLLVFSTMFLTGFSQNEQANKKIKLGLNASVSQIHFTDIYEWRDFLCFEGCAVNDLESNYGFTIGLTGSFSLNDKLEVISGLQYAQKSYYEEGFNFFSTYRIKRTIKYIQVPALLRYKFYSTDTKKVQAFADFGVNTLFNINTNMEEQTYESYLKGVGLSAQTGLGLAINFEKFTMAVGPQLSYAVSNLGAKDHTDGPDKNKLRPIELGIGLSVFY